MRINLTEREKKYVNSLFPDDYWLLKKPFILEQDILKLVYSLELNNKSKEFSEKEKKKRFRYIYDNDKVGQ